MQRPTPYYLHEQPPRTRAVVSCSSPLPHILPLPLWPRCITAHRQVPVPPTSQAQTAYRCAAAMERSSPHTLAMWAAGGTGWPALSSPTCVGCGYAPSLTKARVMTRPCRACSSPAAQVVEPSLQPLLVHHQPSPSHRYSSLGVCQSMPMCRSLQTAGYSCRHSRTTGFATCDMTGAATCV